MANRKIKINAFSSQSIQDAIDYLQSYKSDLKDKNEIFMEKLAEKGIKVINEDKVNGDSHKFYDMVRFEKEWNGKKLVLYGENSDLSKLHTLWYDGQGNKHTETISPILALEYGTAGLAIKGHGGSAAVTGNHVNDTEWLYYSDIDKNGHPIKPKRATAEEPHYPMYRAWFEMKMEIVETAKEVFGA